jgi:hypothetical protein
MEPWLRQYTRLFPGMLPDDHLRQNYSLAHPVASLSEAQYLAVAQGIMITLVWPGTETRHIAPFRTAMRNSLQDTAFEEVLEMLMHKEALGDSPDARAVWRGELLQKIIKLDARSVIAQMKRSLTINVAQSLQSQAKHHRPESPNEVLMQIYSDKFNVVILIWRRLKTEASTVKSQAFFPKIGVHEEKPAIVHLWFDSVTNYHVLIPKAVVTHIRIDDSPPSEEAESQSDVLNVVIYSREAVIDREDYCEADTTLKKWKREIKGNLMERIANRHEQQAAKQLKFLPDTPIVRLLCGCTVEVRVLRQQIDEKSSLLAVNEFEETEDVNCYKCGNLVGLLDKMKILGTESYNYLHKQEVRRFNYIKGLTQCGMCLAYKPPNEIEQDLCVNCIEAKHSSQEVVSENQMRLLTTLRNAHCCKQRCVHWVLNTDPVSCEGLDCKVCLPCKREHLHDGCFKCSRRYTKPEKRLIELAYPVCKKCKSRLTRSNRCCNCLCAYCHPGDKACGLCGKRNGDNL